MLASPTHAIRRLTWETSGGGDLRFDVVPAGTDFVLHVSRYAGEDVCDQQEPHDSDHETRLTPAAQGLYRTVQGIFQGDLDPEEFTFVPVGLAGTWIDMRGELGDLYRLAKTLVQRRSP